MRVLCCFILLSLLTGHSFGQKEANNWYFGNFAGLSFNQSPPQALSEGRLQSEEGCATISDSRGQLLFYSNGGSLINRGHSTLKNSVGLLGDRSSTQNVVIVPQPGNDSIYFVFTIASIQLDEVGLHYSVVNMRRDNGFGEVVQKNVPLLTETYEKITAVKHCNNQDVWVMVHKWDSDEYYAYQVTTGGVISSPVISSTGFVVGGDPANSIGAMKFSSKGHKLAAAYSYGIDKVELLDFDNQTGIVSNSVVFKANSFTGALEFSGTYGLDFSPTNQYLYVSAFNSLSQPTSLYQFDISSNTAPGILATRQVIAQTTSGGGVGNIQIAPDSKLYVSYLGKNRLGVINDPDVAGAGCNFQFDGPLIDASGTRYAQSGLPTFIQSYFDTSYIPYDFSTNSRACTDQDISFTINRTNNIDSVHWYFGDGGETTSYNPSHHYAATGFYNVTLRIFRPSCSGINVENHVKQLWIAPSANFLQGDITACDVSNTLLGVNIPGVNYQWSTGSTNDSITVNTAGIYWLELEKNGCTVRDSVTIKKIEPPLLDIGADTTVCSAKPVQLDAVIPNAAYLWNTGEVTKTISVNKPGKYRVTVSPVGGCSVSDSLQVGWGDCELLVPTAFSPNGDHVNDEFGLTDGINVTAFKMNIYNRYGELVFKSSDFLQKWDGKFKGRPVPVGLYPWVMSYRNKFGTLQIEKGTVMVLR